MNFEEIKLRVHTALALLKLNDGQLLDNNTSERAIAHKLASYLSIVFQKFDVDCEYNRVGSMKNSKKGGKNNCITPDIVIHIRQKEKKEDNLLFIEIKKNRESKKDQDKLESATSGQCGYQYYYGLFLKFKNSNNSVTTRWFISGAEEETSSFIFSPRPLPIEPQK